MKDLFGYVGKRVVVTGAFSGMGEATARLLGELGAEVYTLDIKEAKVPAKKYIRTDLKNKGSIDAAVAQIPGDIDGLFNCAGLPGPPFSEVDVLTVNFLGHRHLAESLIPRMKPGAAIGFIASVGGYGWQGVFADIKPLLETSGFDEGHAWLEANPDAIATGYVFSKQCIVSYVKTRALTLAEKGIRINCISPGATQTPMTAQFEAAYGKEGVLMTYGLNGRPATPEEQAMPLVFLNSQMASFVSGVDLYVDYGYGANFELMTL